MRPQRIVNLLPHTRLETDLVIQAHLEDLAPAHDAHIVTLSIDVANCRSADLGVDSRVRFWRGLIRDGWVLATIAGPPCETWSTARYRPGGPRPMLGILEMSGQIL